MCDRLMLKFLQKSFMEVADIVDKFANVPLLHAVGHKAASKLDVGFDAKTHLTTMMKK